MLSDDNKSLIALTEHYVLIEFNILKGQVPKSVHKYESNAGILFLS